MMRALLHHRPIFECLCTHLSTLPNVLRLARLDKETYGRVTQYLPELALMRGSHFTTWSGLVRTTPTMHLIVWRYICERTICYKTIYHGPTVAAQMELLLEGVFVHSRWDWLESLVAQVASWRRLLQMSYSREEPRPNLIVTLPEIQVLWSKVLFVAIRNDHRELADHASAQLFRYVANPDVPPVQFNDAWLSKARPEISPVKLWEQHVAWYNQIVMPTVEKESRDLQERKNAQCIRDMLLKYK